MRAATKFRIIFYSIFGGFLLGACLLAIPNFVSRRPISPKNNCINNLRQLDGAKQQWALEMKMLSNSVPTASEIAPYLRPEGMKCPSGGKYTLNPVWQLPTCSITNHILK